MIPLKIQIKNFLSYGPDSQTIDFTRYQMICLSGKNGHGKSALLDAITWAVWGQARKSSGQPKPDHGLLHLGERNMKVIFDFEFNSRCYRVRREFTFAYGKPSAYLEFGMFVDGSEELISLTDKTIRKTQAKIELLLGLDFDSFVNSAFIRQGNSSEFSNKSPKERKEILGNILGLGLYDKLRKLAAEKARLIENDRQGSLKLQDRLKSEITKQSETEELVKSLNHKLIAIQNTEQQYQLLFDEYQKKQQTFFVLRELGIKNNKKLEDVTINYYADLDKLGKLRADWHQLLIKINNFSNKSQLELQKSNLHQKLVDLRLKQKENWQNKELLAQANIQYQKIELTLFNDYDQKLNQLVLELDKSQFNLNYQQDIYQKDEHELNLLIQLQISDKSKLQEYDELQQKQQSLQKKFEKYKEFYQRLIVVGNNAKSVQDELLNKQHYLEENCPTCPLCEQNLSVDRKRVLSQQLLIQIDFAQHRIKRITKILKDLKVKIVDQHAFCEIQNKRLKDLSIWYAQFNQNETKILVLQNKLAEIKSTLIAARLLLDQQKINLEQYRTNRFELLKNNSEIQELKILIKNYEQKINDNFYDEAELEIVQSELESLDRLLTIDNTDYLINQKAQILALISSVIQELKTKKAVIFELKLQTAQNSQIDCDLNHLAELSSEVLNNLNQCKSQRDSILQELGRVQEQLDKMHKIKLEVNQLKFDLDSLDSLSQDYKSLVNAFGKDGLQALLIEDAIPEIEQEANYLLGRLTDNQAQLFIESLRDLKSGGTKETLDIKISDNVGLRPYEMFSGGEAFRIDFALRIAISKLLAKRAGTALQTLIIDEGFGSQDEEGLVHIMDALYKIQDDFAKIIIVSHLSSMKEQFPVQFFIQKTATGSTVNIIEQG